MRKGLEALLRQHPESVAEPLLTLQVSRRDLAVTDAEAHYLFKERQLKTVALAGTIERRDQLNRESLWRVVTV